ncbi:Dps family protein [Leisingera methylohalidivorans]|uniref:Ferritin n=1 Tax=Leisingera methylohalidivorans DSM 14336 TaxID=999552 RepID=V9VW76_9RHOB|nr:ferritin-like domain-containing protein [Leisingera methylohalidivorans]AHD02208.1 ferritin [Leisingera methylohalidivorans DSM 14336]
MTTKLEQDPSADHAKADIPNTASVTKAVSEVLAETYRLVLKPQTYHWNVTGPLFFSIHEMTEAQYTGMFTAADVLAERIRALGKPAPVNPAALAAGPDGEDPDAKLSANKFVRVLLTDH